MYMLVCTFQDLAHGLGELLTYEGNVEEDFYTTFQVNLTGTIRMFALRLFSHSMVSNR